MVVPFTNTSSISNEPPVTKPEAVTVVNAPVEAELAPIAAPSMAPPSMFTASAFCVDIVPRFAIVVA